jgi:hypothetical protein
MWPQLRPGIPSSSASWLQQLGQLMRARRQVVLTLWQVAQLVLGGLQGDQLAVSASMRRLHC